MSRTVRPRLNSAAAEAALDTLPRSKWSNSVSSLFAFSEPAYGARVRRATSNRSIVLAEVVTMMPTRFMIS